MNVGTRVMLKGFTKQGRIESIYRDSSGEPVYTVKMDDPDFNESGYMLARVFEIEECIEQGYKPGEVFVPGKSIYV